MSTKKQCPWHDACFHRPCLGCFVLIFAEQNRWVAASKQEAWISELVHALPRTERGWGAGSPGEEDANVQSSGWSFRARDTKWGHQVLKILYFPLGAQPEQALLKEEERLGFVCCLKWKLTDELFCAYCLFLSIKWFSHHNLMALFSLTHWYWNSFPIESHTQTVLLQVSVDLHWNIFSM